MRSIRTDDRAGSTVTAAIVATQPRRPPSRASGPAPPSPARARASPSMNARISVLTAADAPRSEVPAEPDRGHERPATSADAPHGRAGRERARPRAAPRPATAVSEVGARRARRPDHRSRRRPSAAVAPKIAIVRERRVVEPLERDREQRRDRRASPAARARARGCPGSRAARRARQPGGSGAGKALDDGREHLHLVAADHGVAHAPALAAGDHAGRRSRRRSRRSAMPASSASSAEMPNPGAIASASFLRSSVTDARK